MLINWIIKPFSIFPPPLGIPVSPFARLASHYYYYYYYRTRIEITPFTRSASQLLSLNSMCCQVPIRDKVQIIRFPRLLRRRRWSSRGLLMVMAGRQAGNRPDRSSFPLLEPTDIHPPTGNSLEIHRASSAVHGSRRIIVARCRFGGFSSHIQSSTNNPSAHTHLRTFIHAQCAPPMILFIVCHFGVAASAACSVYRISK